MHSAQHVLRTGGRDTPTRGAALNLVPSANQFSECVDAIESEPLRQGDVFEWLTDTGDPWERFGIIVTADCDIAYAKHRGVLSYVPVLQARDYVRLFYLPPRVQRIANSLYDELFAKVRQFQGTHVPEFSGELSDDALRIWFRSTSADRIADDLRIREASDREPFLRLAAVCTECDAALASEDFDRQFEAAIHAREFQNSKGDHASRLWREIRDALEHLPGDAFFIGALGRDHRDGYIAYLRLVREINETEVAVRPLDLRHDGVRAKRSARLISPFVYRLTQQLASVFTAIGLPGEYEAHRATLLASYQTRTPSGA